MRDGTLSLLKAAGESTRLSLEYEPPAWDAVSDDGGFADFMDPRAIGSRRTFRS